MRQGAPSPRFDRLVVQTEQQKVRALSSRPAFKRVRSTIQRLVGFATQKQVPAMQRDKHLSSLRTVLSTYLKSRDQKRFQQLQTELQRRLDAFRKQKKKPALRRTAKPSKKPYEQVLDRANQALRSKDGIRGALRIAKQALRGTSLSKPEQTLLIMQIREWHTALVEREGRVHLEGTQFVRDSRYDLMLGRLRTSKDGKTTVFEPYNPPRRLRRYAIVPLKNKNYPRQGFVGKGKISRAKLGALLAKHPNLQIVGLTHKKNGHLRYKVSKESKARREQREFTIQQRMMVLKERLRTDPHFTARVKLRSYARILSIQVKAAEQNLWKWVRQFSTTGSMVHSITSLLKWTPNPHEIDTVTFNKKRRKIRALRLMLATTKALHKNWPKIRRDPARRKRVLRNMASGRYGSVLAEISLSLQADERIRRQAKARNLGPDQIRLMRRASFMKIRLQLMQRNKPVDPTSSPGRHASQTLTYFSQAREMYCRTVFTINGKPHSIYTNNGKNSLSMKLVHYLRQEKGAPKDVTIASAKDLRRLLPAIRKLAKTNHLFKHFLKSVPAELRRLTAIDAARRATWSPSHSTMQTVMEDLRKQRSKVLAYVRSKQPGLVRKMGGAIGSFLDDPVNLVGLLSSAVGGGIAASMIRSGRLLRFAEATTKARAAYQAVIASAGEVLVANLIATTSQYAMKLATGRIGRNDSFLRDLAFNGLSEGMILYRFNLGKLASKLGAQRAFMVRIIDEVGNMSANAAVLTTIEIGKMVAEQGSFTLDNFGDLLIKKVLVSRLSLAYAKAGGAKLASSSSRTNAVGTAVGRRLSSAEQRAAEATARQYAQLQQRQVALQTAWQSARGKGSAQMQKVITQMKELLRDISKFPPTGSGGLVLAS